MDIRRAVMDDVPLLLDLGQAMVDESAEYFPPVEHERSHRHIQMTVTYPELAFAAIAIADDGCPAGFTLAMAGDYPYSVEIRGAIDVLYVLPAYRGTRAAVGLMRLALAWLAERDARVVIFGQSTGIDGDGFERFTKHFGFRPAGTIYRLEES